MFLSSLYSLSWGWCTDRSSEFALSSFSFWIFKNNWLACSGSVPEPGSQAGVQGQALQQPLTPGKAWAEAKPKAWGRGQGIKPVPPPHPQPETQAQAPAWGEPAAAPPSWPILRPSHPLSGLQCVKCKIRDQGGGGGLSPLLGPCLTSLIDRPPPRSLDEPQESFSRPGSGCLLPVGCGLQAGLPSVLEHDYLRGANMKGALDKYWMNGLFFF